MATGEAAAETGGLVAAAPMSGVLITVGSWESSLGLTRTEPGALHGVRMSLAKPTGLPAELAAEMASLADAAAGAVLTPVTPVE